jgi:hypothetical protein
MMSIELAKVSGAARSMRISACFLAFFAGGSHKRLAFAKAAFA